MIVNKRRRGQRGFTLIELLIVVVVIAILASIAVPMYRDFVVRSNRSQAIIALTELANLEEKFYSNELRYTTSIDSQLNYPTLVPNGDDPLYTLAITSSTTVEYTLTATPVGPQLQNDDTCQEFTLNSFGQRSSQDSGGNDTSQQCWSR